jgi:hypothetical protein
MCFLVLLNLLSKHNIKSSSCSNVFLTVHWKIFPTKFLSIYVISLHTDFNIIRSNKYYTFCQSLLFTNWCTKECNNCGYLSSWHPNLHEQGFEDPWLFFGDKGGLRTKTVWETVLQGLCLLVVNLSVLQSRRKPANLFDLLKWISL